MHEAAVIEISKFGPPEVLKIRKQSIAPPAPDEMIIRVRAIGLNFADIFERLGLYAAAPKAPFVPGFEVAGTVEEVGSSVEQFERGQRVLAVTRFGGYQTLLKTQQSLVRALPDDFTFEEGAGFATTYLTAYHGLLNLAHLQHQESVLIHAAAGGVGTAAVQIAQVFDAEIFATCGSQEKTNFLKEMGIEHTIDYRKTDFEKEVRSRSDTGGIDIIMDSVGGETFRKGYRLLNPMGRLIVFGLGDLMPSGRKPNWPKLAYKYLTLPRFGPAKLIGDNKTVAGFNLAYMFKFKSTFSDSMDQLMAWVRDGRLRTVVGRTFPFEQAAQAQTYLQSRQSIGKVVLTVD